MEAYPRAPQVIQGQPVYQALVKTNVMPQIQQQIQSNVSLPNGIASGFQYGNIVNCSGLNQASYVLQDVNNSNKVLMCVPSSGFTNNMLSINPAPENNQTGQVQNVQITGQGLNNVRVRTSAPQVILPKQNLTNPQTKGPVKIPEPTHVNLNTHVSEKIGSLKIHISESFLPWDITNKTILDLEFMKHLFNISGVDVIVKDQKHNEKALRVAVGQLLQSKVLSDWLVLKCEEKEIPFFKVTNQVEIYTTRNFTALLNVVSQESCLPIPYITEEKSYVKYLYVNFPKTGNDKVKKLSLPVFHVADDEKKKLPCKYPGIRMDCEFESAVENFTVHVHDSALSVYQAAVSEVRQHIIYRHIIWGFLQMWIRLVMEQYNKCFKFGDIAKSLSLCKAEVSADGRIHGSNNTLIYDIGYMNCYLKFDPITLRKTKASFSLDNFTTSTVCNLSIVQYYKQYFLINDMHYSDALRNTVLFFRNCNYGTVPKPNNLAGIPPNLRPIRVLPNNNYSSQMQPIAYLKSAQVNGANLPPSTSGVPAHRASGAESYEKGVFEFEPEQTSVSQALAKPFLKTRTVEEINSSVNTVLTTGMNNNNINNKNINVNNIASNNKSDNRNNITGNGNNNNINNNVNNSSSVTNNYDDNNNDDSDDRADGNNDNDNNPRVCQMYQATHSLLKDGDRILKYEAFVSLVQEIMGNCYKSNSLQISANDESNEREVMRRRFDEAVRRAIKEETLESFIGKMFRHLQLFYTNATCQKLLNTLVWRAIEAKYPHLKEQMSIKVVKSLEEKSSVCGTRSRDVNAALSYLESDVRLNMPVIADEENGRRKGATTLSVSLQSESANSDSEGGVTYYGESEDATTGSEETSVVPKRAPSPDVIPKKVNDNRSKKSRKHDKKRRSKKEGKDVPYRNTLTIVRVSDSPATFRISTKSRITQNSAVEENERCDTLENLPMEEPNQNCDAPKNLLIGGPNERCDVPKSIPIEESNERRDVSENLLIKASDERFDTPEDPVEESNELEEQEKSVQIDVPPVEEEKFVQTDDIPEEQNRYVQTDQPDELPEEQDRSIQSDDVSGQVDKEYEKKKGICRGKEYAEYKLKTCSVVLNPKDIQVYIGNGGKRKRGDTSLVDSFSDSELESESESESGREPGQVGKRRYLDDSDDSFAPDKKRYKKTVSEIQYMEARTRVLQRLRKRKSLYGAYERTRISGEELDSFLVRGSPTSKLDNNEKKRKRNEREYEEERENEQEVEDDGGSDEEMDSEDEESHWRELKKRYGIKELLVVVTRLEETPEYEKHCLKLLRIEGWNPALEYLTRENFPLNKAIRNKYFDLRDGKLYLKKNYQVVNGVIVPVEDVPLSPKREPDSPAREIDFDIDRVKSESE